MLGRKLLFAANLFLCHSLVHCWHHLDQQQDDLNRNAWRARGNHPVHQHTAPYPPESRWGNDGEKQLKTIEQRPQTPHEFPVQEDSRGPVGGSRHRPAQRIEEEEGGDRGGLWKAASDEQSLEEQVLSRPPSRFPRDRKQDDVEDNDQQQTLQIFDRLPAPGVEMEDEEYGPFEQKDTLEARKRLMWKLIKGSDYDGGRRREGVSGEVEHHPGQQEKEEDLIQQLDEGGRRHSKRQTRRWALGRSDSSSESDSDSSSESDKNRKERNIDGWRSSESEQSESSDSSSSSPRRPAGRYEGYEEYEGVGIYRFDSDGASSFDEASEQCESEGAHLAIANSKDEADVFVTLWRRHGEAEDDEAYVGIHNRNPEGEFKTVLGSPIASTGYLAWRAGEPNNKNGVEHCVSFFRYGGYRDIPCAGTRPFICEMRWKGET